MFEVNIFTPAQFGAFVAWLVINRGPLSALVHPNTDDAEVSASSLQTNRGIYDAGMLMMDSTARSYPASDVAGGQIALGHEYSQADERGEDENGEGECRMK